MEIFLCVILRHVIRGLPSAILALTALALSSFLGSTKGPDLGFAPQPGSTDAAGLDGDTWKMETKEVSIRLRQLHDSDRQAFLREHAHTDTDPFVTHLGGHRGFQTFLLELENKGRAAAIFQPQSCRLIVQKHEILYPLDFPALVSAYSSLQSELPPAYRAALKAMFDGERILAPGEKISGLLIYRGIDPADKRFTVEVALTTSAGKNVGFEAPYKRVSR